MFVILFLYHITSLSKQFIGQLAEYKGSYIRYPLRLSPFWLRVRTMAVSRENQGRSNLLKEQQKSVCDLISR